MDHQHCANQTRQIMTEGQTHQEAQRQSSSAVIPYIEKYMIAFGTKGRPWAVLGYYQAVRE
jgi:hypothetical protein